MILNREIAETILLGSLALGCGGGGNEAQGRKMFTAAFDASEKSGKPIELITVDELIERNPKGGVVLTLSGVGSPSSKTAYTPPEYYPRLMELIEKQLDEKIIGFIACEIGGSSSFEPFMPAAITGLPVVDAPCDGRAHPLGLMGSLGLEKKGIPVVQAAVGGRKETGHYTEISVKSKVESAAHLIRCASSEAGGFISVARNPVDAKWLSEKGAMGSYVQAIELGEACQKMAGEEYNAVDLADAMAKILKGKVVGTGSIESYRCATDNALDNGGFILKCGDENIHNEYHVTFFNEYMTLEDEDGKRIATFPDGIIFIGDDKKTYSSAMLAAAAVSGELDSIKFTLVITDYSNLIVPAGVRYRGSYMTIEEVVKKDMIVPLEERDFFLD